MPADNEFVINFINVMNLAEYCIQRGTVFQKAFGKLLKAAHGLAIAKRAIDAFPEIVEWYKNENTTECDVEVNDAREYDLARRGEL